MALLEFVDLLTGFILGVFHRLTDLVPPLVCLVGCDVLARLLHFFCRFLSVAPRLLCRTFALLHNSLIGKLFVADSFSNALLYLSHRLLNLARNLILNSLFFSLVAVNAAFFYACFSESIRLQIHGDVASEHCLLSF